MTTVRVKPAGALAVPLPRSMRRPSLMAIPVAGASVALTRFIQRRIDQGDLVLVPEVPAKGAAANASADPAKGS